MSGDTAWLEDLRQRSWEAYHDAPDPSRALHLWRYTDPALFRIPEQVIDGSPRPALVAAEQGVPAGLEVLDLEEAAATQPGMVRDRLATLVPAGSGRLEALNLARFQHGLVIRAPRGVKAASALSLMTRAGSARRFNASRLLIIAEEDSSIDIIRHYAGGNAGNEPHLNGVIEVFAAPRSRVRLVVVQDLGDGARLHLVQRTRADREAHSETVMVSIGGAVTKADIGTILAGEGAESESWGVVFGDGNRHFDHHTVHEHAAPHTHSNFNYKAVLRGRSRSVYTGSIRIGKDAPHCEAYQENRNLMLDDTARADSIPELEILNNDVACTHGATMGPIEPEYLYYLESRGIPHADAVRLFVDGFVSPALSRIPEPASEDLRGRLAARMEAH